MKKKGLDETFSDKMWFTPTIINFLYQRYKSEQPDHKIIKERKLQPFQLPFANLKT